MVQNQDSFDDFSISVSELVKSYDGGSLSQEAFKNEYYSKRLIVQIKKGKTLDLSQYGAEAVICGPNGLNIMQFNSEEKAQNAYTEIIKSKKIDYCEPDTYAKTNDINNNNMNDKKHMSWGVSTIGADTYAEYVKTLTNDSVTVAVVDTGVYKHKFLKNRILEGGYDFVDGDKNPDDKQYHGTHVAGTIVDCTPGLSVNVLPVRVLDSNGSAPWSIISLGIRYAANRGAEVVNLSIQGNASETCDRAIDYAIQKGAIVVVCAGNYNINTKSCSPARLKKCIVVSAIDSQLKKADFSNYGNSIDIAAPGVSVRSCVPRYIGEIRLGGTEKELSGTSMATPHISAIVAMMLLENPKRTPKTIEKSILYMCKDIGSKGWDKYYGYGVPDLNKYVQQKGFTPQKPGNHSKDNINFKNILEKTYVYFDENKRLLYGFIMGKNGKAYLGIWNETGTSSSYEDFYFKIQEETSVYSVTGGRSENIYKIKLIPRSKNKIKISIQCDDYTDFNIKSEVFVYEPNLNLEPYINDNADFKENTKDEIDTSKPELETPIVNDWYIESDEYINSDVRTQAITWSSVSEADGYEVEFSNREYGEDNWYQEKTEVKDEYYSFSCSGIYIDLKIRVRAYLNLHGQTYYSKWSDEKSARFRENGLENLY